LVNEVHVTCPRCREEHNVNDLTTDERLSVEENAYGEDTLRFRCRECGEDVKGIIWRRR